MELGIVNGIRGVVIEFVGKKFKVRLLSGFEYIVEIENFEYDILGEYCVVK